MAGGPIRCQGSAMAKRDEEREKRLAEALRENLRRRKAQARGEEGAPSPSPDADASRAPPASGEDSPRLSSAHPGDGRPDAPKVGEG
jgi:hypothetical protein